MHCIAYWPRNHSKEASTLAPSPCFWLFPFIYFNNLISSLLTSWWLRWTRIRCEQIFPNNFYELGNTSWCLVTPCITKNLPWETFPSFVIFILWTLHLSGWSNKWRWISDRIHEVWEAYHNPGQQDHDQVCLCQCQHSYGLKLNQRISLCTKIYLC